MTKITTTRPGGLTSLASIVARASQALPAQTGATAAAVARIERGDVRIILADVSGSMAESAGGRSKISILRDAMRGVPPETQVIAFATGAVALTASQPLPDPGGGTALHTALIRAKAADPTHVLVVSDGHPDDPGAALTAADDLGADVRIDIIYCGPDNDAKGIAFMRRLARGGGSAHHHSMARAPERLAAEVRRLALPAR